MQKSKQHRTHTESGTRRFPLYEKYINWTPYQYAMNNPISNMDIDGLLVLSKADRMQFVKISIYCR